MREIKDVAILYGFNQAGMISYSQILGLSAYYGGYPHVWDSWDSIKALGIVRLVGILFDPEGNISQEWENTYDESSGMLTGTRDLFYREHLKTDEKRQKLIDRMNELRKQRDDPPA